MHEERSLYRASPTYMDRQPRINAAMRSILLDWLVEVHLDLMLHPETLYLTAELTDRFLELKVVARIKLQLVGVVALRVACRLTKEFHPPSLERLVYYCDGAVKLRELQLGEKFLLKTLQRSPTRYLVALPDVSRPAFVRAAGCEQDSVAEHYIGYLAELSLLDYSMLRFSWPRIIAAAAYIARRALGKRPAYPPSLQQHSGYTLERLRPAVRAIQALHAKAPSASVNATYRKYSQARFDGVAALPGPPEAA